MADFTLPELGENIAAGDVLRVLVNPGDTIAKDQAVLELETDKATIEVPSSVAGTVKEVKVKAGDKVKVGQAILSVDDGAARAPATPKPAAAGEGGKPAPALAQAPTKAADRPPTSTAESVPDLSPAAQPRDQSTEPDKSGVRDPTVGPQAAAGDQVPARGKDNVVDINRGGPATRRFPSPIA